MLAGCIRLEITYFTVYSSVRRFNYLDKYKLEFVLIICPIVYYTIKYNKSQVKLVFFLIISFIRDAHFLCS